MEPAGPWHFEAETCKDGAGRYKQPSCTWSGGETDERVPGGQHAEAEMYDPE